MKLAHVSFQIQTCTQLCTHGQGGRQTQSDGEDSRCPCRLGHTLPFSGAGPGQPSRRRLARARAPGLGWGSSPIEGLPAPGLQGWAGAALPLEARLHQGSRAGPGQERTLGCLGPFPPRPPALQADSLLSEPPGKPRWLSKEPARQCRRCRRRGFDPWVWKIL